jgi:hypothetical protein
VPLYCCSYTRIREQRLFGLSRFRLSFPRRHLNLYNVGQAPGLRRPLGPPRFPESLAPPVPLCNREPQMPPIAFARHRSNPPANRAFQSIRHDGPIAPFSANQPSPNWFLSRSSTAKGWNTKVIMPTGVHLLLTPRTLGPTRGGLGGRRRPGACPTQQRSRNRVQPDAPVRTGHSAERERFVPRRDRRGWKIVAACEGFGM